MRPNILQTVILLLVLRLAHQTPAWKYLRRIRVVDAARSPHVAEKGGPRDELAAIDNTNDVIQGTSPTICQHYLQQQPVARTHLCAHLADL